MIKGSAVALPFCFWKEGLCEKSYATIYGRSLHIY